MTLVSGADDRLAFRAARELDRRPALAALVAPARPGDAADRRRHQGLRDAARSAVRRRWSRVRWSPDRASPRGTAAEKALAAAVAGGRLPVSWLPAAEAGATGAGGRRALVAAARANVQTLVRACWPGTLAPGLSSTRLGFAFVDARHTGVGVVSASDTAAAALLQRLRLWGFPAARLPADDGGLGAGGTGRGHRLPAGVAGGRPGPGRRPGTAARKCRQGWRHAAQDWS